MKKRLTALPTELLVEGLPTVEDLTVTQQFDPTTIAVAYVRGKNNYHSYKYEWEHRMKVANLLSIGGKVLVVLPYSNMTPVLVRHKDQETIDHFQIKQLMFLFTKYNKITSEFYSNLGKTLFAGYNKGQVRQFNSNIMPVLNADRPWATEVLDAEYAEALEHFEIPRQVNLKAWAERQNLQRLWNEAANELRIFESQEELIKTLPNQEVTAMDGSASAKLEAALVNAWYYKQAEFRVPSLDDQIKELEDLREWFEEYKYHARRNNVKKPQQAILEKFERLEWLEIEVGPYLQGDQGLATLGNPPRTSQHDSRAFKLNRLSQLFRRKDELNTDLLEELQELVEELNK